MEPHPVMVKDPTFKCGSCQAAHEFAEYQLGRARKRIVELENELRAERSRSVDLLMIERRAV